MREAIIKKMYTYHLDQVPWWVTKTHSPVCIFFKKTALIISFYAPMRMMK